MGTGGRFRAAIPGDVSSFGDTGRAFGGGASAAGIVGTAPGRYARRPVWRARHLLVPHAPGKRPGIADTDGRELRPAPAGRILSWTGGLVVRCGGGFCLAMVQRGTTGERAGNLRVRRDWSIRGSFLWACTRSVFWLAEHFPRDGSTGGGLGHRILDAGAQCAGHRQTQSYRRNVGPVGAGKACLGSLRVLLPDLRRLRRVLYLSAQPAQRPVPPCSG